MRLARPRLTPNNHPLCLQVGADVVFLHPPTLVEDPALVIKIKTVYKVPMVLLQGTAHMQSAMGVDDFVVSLRPPDMTL